MKKNLLLVGMLLGGLLGTLPRSGATQPQVSSGEGQANHRFSHQASDIIDRGFQIGFTEAIFEPLSAHPELYSLEKCESVEGVMFKLHSDGYERWKAEQTSERTSLTQNIQGCRNTFSLKLTFCKDERLEVEVNPTREEALLP